MTNIEILNAWFKYSNFKEEKPYYTFRSNSDFQDFDIQIRNKLIKEMVESFDNCGNFSVCYAEYLYNKYIKNKAVTIYDMLIDKSVLQNERQINAVFQDEQLQKTKKEIKGIIENCIPPDNSIGQLGDDIFSYIYDSYTSLKHCQTDIMNSFGKPFIPLQKFTTKIKIFNTLAECSFDINCCPEGIYMCYIRCGDTCDGYFLFALHSNGNLVFISDRYKERFIGQIQNLRNKRYTEEKGFELFPYSCIEFSEETDYKGYSTKYKINEDKICFEKFNQAEQVRIILAILFLNYKYNGKTFSKNAICYSNKIFTAPNCIDNKTLIIPKNNQIMNRYKNIIIEIPEEDIFAEAAGDRKYFGSENNANEIFNLWKERTKTEDFIKENYVDELKVCPENSNEFIFNQKEMKQQVLMQLRTKLYKRIQRKINKEFKEDDYGNNTIKLYRNLIMNKKNLIMKKTASFPDERFGKTTGQIKFFNEKYYKDFVPFNKIEKKGREYFAVENNRKASLIWHFHPLSSDEICSFFEMDENELPVLMRYWTYNPNNHQCNSLIEEYDDIDLLNNAFTELEHNIGNSFHNVMKRYDENFNKTGWKTLDDYPYPVKSEDELFDSNKISFNTENPFDFEIYFTKTGLKKLRKIYGA